MLQHDIQARRLFAQDRIDALRAAYRVGSSSRRPGGEDEPTFAAEGAPQLCGSPSQQPSFKRQQGHCQVP